MVVDDKQIIALSEWLPAAVSFFGVILLILVIGGAIVGFLVAALRNGPVAAISMTAQSIGTAVNELRNTSLQRVYAMSTLAFREAIRRKVLVVFGVFMVMLLFAGWFLDPGADHPATLYISFVLTATNFLVLMLAVFLSTFSLPNDVKNRTIYTIVTKPVRAWEIVLGRIIGFSAIGTMLLAIMLVFSYFFVVRGLNHTHAVDETRNREVEVEAGGETVTVQESLTTMDNRHRHDLRITEDGIRIEANHDHSHAIVTGEDGVVSLGTSQGDLQARVPKYGKLKFLDRQGKLVDKGVNVGNEWAYRSYIEGGTLAAAIWTFEGLNRTDFKDGVPLEMSIRVFRTHKGDIESAILGTIEVVEAVETKDGEKPKPLFERKRFAPRNFLAREFTADQIAIPIKSKGFNPDGTINPEMLLFEDLVHDGKLEVWIQCGERAQYFGMAQGDLYVRSADGQFAMNFLKGFMGLWFQMVIVTAFAVTFSTFLNGPVAMLATIAAICLGFFAQFVQGLFTGDVEGGGPTESLVRMFRQMNMIIELEPGATTAFIKSFDFVSTMVMAGICAVLPDYGGFNNSDFVAHGFNIQNGIIVRHFLVTFAYVGVLTCVGYFFLKSREIAA